MAKEHNLRAQPPVVPQSRVILSALLALNDHGTTGAVTGQGGVVFDLEQDAADYHEGLLRIEVKTTNGQGGTPTSPGAAATFSLRYAFLSERLTTPLAATDAPTVLANIRQSLVCTLPNSSASTAAGIRWHATDPFVYSGRYLYVWYDRDAFAANALIDVAAKLVRV